MFTSPLHISAARAASTADPLRSRIDLKKPRESSVFSIDPYPDYCCELNNSRIHTYLPISAHGAPSAQTVPRLKVFNLLHDGGWKFSGSGGVKNSSSPESVVLLLAYTLKYMMITAIINAATTAPIMITCCMRNRDLKKNNNILIKTLCKISIKIVTFINIKFSLMIMILNNLVILSK